VSAGCSGEDGLDDEQILHQESRQGLVSVNYEHDWMYRGDVALLTTTAQFVRYSYLDRHQVARLLGLPLDPERDLPSLDQCKTYALSSNANTEEDLIDGRPGKVELLEAGDLQVQTRGRAVASLMPRHFPGLIPFVSGVIYGESQVTMNKQPEQIKASSLGGEGVGRFFSQLSSPALPRLIRLGDALPTAQATLPRDRDLALQWNSAKASPEDVTYVELHYNLGEQELALRCRLRDDGEFSIPRVMLSNVNGKATLKLSRLRRRFFDASGLDHGELRISMRDAATLLLK